MEAPRPTITFNRPTRFQIVITALLLMSVSFLAWERVEKFFAPSTSPAPIVSHDRVKVAAAAWRKDLGVAYRSVGDQIRSGKFADLKGTELARSKGTALTDSLHASAVSLSAAIQADADEAGAYHAVADALEGK